MRAKEHVSGGERTAKVRLSVGIPAHNEERNIGSLLRNVLGQRLSDCVELDSVIVVVSGCTDRTAEIVEEIASEDTRVRLIREEKRRGKASAVNLILKESRGCDILVMLSADNIPTAGSIEEIIKPFLHESSLHESKPFLHKSFLHKSGECAEHRNCDCEVVRRIGWRIGCVSGRPLPVNDNRTLFGFASHLLWNLHHLISMRYPKLTGEFYAMRVGIVDRLPTNIVNDDLYIEYAMRRKGYAIVYADKAKSLMRGPETLGDFIRQRVRVHIGHYQIAGMTGYRPKTTSISDTIRHLIALTSFHNMHFIAASAFFEMIARIVAFFKFHSGRIPVMWMPVETTKTLQDGLHQRQ